jgi:hypothetical protein
MLNSYLGSLRGEGARPAISSSISRLMLMKMKTRKRRKVKKAL